MFVLLVVMEIKKCLSIGIRASHFSPKTLIKLETTEKIWGNFRSRQDAIQTFKMDVVLASFRRCFQAFKRHHLRHRSGAIQASVSSVVFRLASGAIPVVVQAPFKVRLSHHSGAFQANLETPFSGVVRGAIGGTICSVVQAPLEASFKHHQSVILEAPLKRHFQASSRAVFIRRSNAIEGAASLVCLASLTPTRATPFQTSFSGDLDNMQALFFRRFRCH